MKKYLYQILVCGASSIIIASTNSCTNSDELTIGNDFIKTDASLVFTDTVTVQMSTFALDSLSTSGKTIALVGRHSDENIGVLDSKSYIVMGLSTYTMAENAILDSLVLVLVPSGYYYGDTLTNQTINVHRVTENIELKTDQSNFFNTTNFAYDETPIGEKEFKPRPSQQQEIRIPINNALAVELFDKFKSSTAPFEECGGFTYYFNGIVLKSPSPTNSILGFNVNDTSISLNMYYHIEGYDESEVLEIKPSNTSLQFNQISADSTNSVINNISENPKISELLNNNAYLQGGTGIVARVDFPHLKTMLENERNFEIIKAELVIQPSLEMDFKYLPKQLYLYSTNKHNDFISTISDSEGNAITSSLNQDDIYRENTYYTWTITSYLKKLMETGELYYDGILIVPVDYDTKFDHVVIADQHKSKFRTQLKLYLLYYE